MQLKGSSEEFLHLWRRPISNLTSNKDNRRKLPLKDRGNFFLWKSFLGAVCWYSADISPEVQTSLCYWLCQYTSCSSHCPYLRMGKVKESKEKQNRTLPKGEVYHYKSSKCIEENLPAHIWSFEILLCYFSPGGKKKKKKGKIVHKKQANRVYKPGGYSYKQVLVFAVMYCVCKTSICIYRHTWSHDVQQRQILSPTSGIAWMPTD